jgi:WD40 repeat protein
MQYSPSENSNPYVGPRPFNIGETLYGRDYESKALVQLLIPERIVLLHSPSGAGKTSLIQARLVPYLKTEGFAVLPIIEVSTAPISKQAKRSNPYVLSALVRLESNLPNNLQMALEDLAGLSISAYLKKRLADSQRAVLIFDQFEQILTQDPTDKDVKHNFFQQIGEVLRNPYRWALFAMREEYIGALTPYLDAVPTRLKTTFRLNLLAKSAAVEAIQKPARQHGVDFLDEAANQLVDDLRTRQIPGSNDKIDKVLGDSVEPVQLQVICQRLWVKPRQNPKQIGIQDLQKFDINSALADYYAETVGTAAKETSVNERTIRVWIDDHLIITNFGMAIRGQVLRSPKRSEGLDNRVISLLVKAHLLREEKWRDITWYVLSHDRLIDPIRSDNKTWREQHLKPFQRQADDWQRLGKPESFLLRDRELAEAEILAGTLALTKVEKRFLRKSRNAECARKELEEKRRKAELTQLRYEEQRKVARRLRRLLFIAILSLSLAVLTSFYAWQKSQEAEHERELKQSALLLALAKLEPGENQESRERKLLLAVHAINIARDIGESENITAKKAKAFLYPYLAIPLSANNIRTMFFSSDGRWLLTGHRDATVKKWEMANLATAQPQLLHNGQEDDIVISALSSANPGLETNNLATLSFDGKVKVWRIKGSVANTAARPTVLSGEHSALTLSPNGLRLATAGFDGNVRVWQLDDLMTEPVSIPSHSQYISALAFSSNGSHLAAGSSDGSLRIWETANLKTHPVSLPSHGKDVSALVFSLDGSRLAAGSSDGSLRIWKLTDPKKSEPIILSGHEGAVLTLAFSPDGLRLATGGIDGSVRIWELAAPATDPIVLRDFQGADSMANSPISNVAFRPNNVAPRPTSYELATGGRNFMLIWRLVSTDEVIKLACEIAGRNLQLGEWQKFLDNEPYRRVCPNQSMQVFISEADELVSEGEVKKAIALYDIAQQIDKSLEIPASSWSNLCWNGSVQGYASAAMDACERAVKLDPDNGGYRRGRGLARALTEDLSGAIEDFQYYITWAQREGKQPQASIAQHRQWIKVLESGENPFDSATLETLR